MKVQLHTEDFDLTDAIRSFTENCAQDAFKVLSEKIRVDCYYRKEGHDAFSCTLRGKVGRKTIVVKESGPDLYTLIAEAFKDLSRSIHKLKEKKKALAHKQGAKVRDAFQPFDFVATRA